MDGIEIYDPRMRALLRPDSSLVRLAGGAAWSEGPVYVAEEDAVIWSDIPGNRLLRWSAKDGVSEYLKPAHFHNGHYRDLEGRLLACSHGERAVKRLEADGTWSTVVSHHDGKRFNSPNDLVVKSDATIWFTDPDYGLIQPNEGYGGAREQAGCFVYRFDPRSGEIAAAVTDMRRPNGLAFSPDESLLYVSDTSASHDADGFHHLRVYEVDGRTVRNGRVFAEIEPGVPDGFRADARGNLFVSSADSVQVYAPEGIRLGKIRVPEKVGNLTFGGPDKNRLFITASTSLYAIELNTTGTHIEST